MSEFLSAKEVQMLAERTIKALSDQNAELPIEVKEALKTLMNYLLKKLGELT